MDLCSTKEVGLMHSGIAKGLAVVVSTGALIGGGAALANAASGGSDSGSSSTAPKSAAPPAASQQPRSGHHCPHMNGSGNSGSGFQGPAPDSTQT
jgi:hypothetical protein